MHRLICRFALGALLAAFAAMAALGQFASARPSPAHRSISSGLLIPTNPGELLPFQSGTVDSLNWSGYADTSKSHAITAVAGTFKVPAAGLIPPGFAATWAGIGGYNTKDLIQAGTAEQSLPSNPLAGPQYYAWYELLPQSETQIGGCAGEAKCTVKPGDRIRVKISQTGSNRWRISMRDAGHWTWSKNVTYRSTRSSAEWILEAPTVGAQTLMADVGTVRFGPTSTYKTGGSTHTIAQGKPVKVVLSAAGVANEATPSALAARGQAFNDCAYALSCPKP